MCGIDTLEGSHPSCRQFEGHIVDFGDTTMAYFLPATSPGSNLGDPRYWENHNGMFFASCHLQKASRQQCCISPCDPRPALPLPIRMTHSRPATIEAAAGAALRRIAADILRTQRCHLHELEIVEAPRGLVLHGRARSYYGKQIAYHEVSRRSGMRILANRIVVEDASCQAPH